MGSFVDLTGHKQGRLTVLEYAGKNASGRTTWKCKCSCGNVVYITIHELRNSRKPQQSCGCLRNELSGDRVRKHGLSGNKRLFNIWCHVRTRCNNPHSKSYTRYGGRGIKVCEEWKNNFEVFYEWAMQNGYKDNLTLDRINNDGDYEPNNCRWADFFVQANNRSNNHFLTYKGKTQTIQQWANELKMSDTILRDRINKLGWSIEDTLETPYLGKQGEKRWQQKRKTN